MEEAPVQPRRGGRRRGNRRDDDDDDEQPQQQQQQLQQQPQLPLQPSSVPPSVPDGALLHESGQPQPPMGGRFAAKAPAAAHVDPAVLPIPPAPAPAPSAAAAPPSSNGTVAFPTPTTSGEESGGRPAALTHLALEDVLNLDYDALSYDALLSLLKRVTHTQMEALVAREQQMQLLEQQEGQRVERFLDAGIDYRGSNASSPYQPSHSSEEAGSNRLEGNEEGYTYHIMLTHLFEALNRNNEGSAMTERNPIPVPILEKIGKKKTAISNFGRICEAFHRPMEDVKDFIEKELSTRGNLDSNRALILKFEIRKATDFDHTLIKYLDEYVKCYSCHRIDTTLTKDGRRLELRCNWCTATRTVQAVSSATYSAQIEKRSRQRAAMTL